MPVDSSRPISVQRERKNLIRCQQELITEKRSLAACVKKAGSFGTVFLGKQTKGIQRLFTNMVLHTFRVATGDFGLTPNTNRNFRLSDVARGFPAPASLLLPLKHATPGSFQSAHGCQSLNILATVGCETPDEQPCPPDELPHFLIKSRNQLQRNHQ